MSGLPDKEHLLVSEVAEFLRCSESHVRDLAHEGELEGFRVEEVKTTYHFGRKRGRELLISNYDTETGEKIA